MKLPPKNRIFSPGESVGDFEILELLGDDGAFGRAYRVRWALLPTIDLALKVYKPHVSAESILREVKAHERIVHPNVARLVDSGLTSDGNRYLLTELVEGSTLAEVFEADGWQFSLCECLAVASQLLSAAQSFHPAPTGANADFEGPQVGSAHGIVHRDITPRNIVVTDSLVAKVIDFGIASPAGAVVRTATATAGFLPPGWDTDVRRNTWEPWIDVFQIGSVIYYALAGELPYSGSRFRPLRELRGDCPDDVDVLMARSVQTEKNARFTSAAEMLSEVSAVMEFHGCDGPPGTTSGLPLGSAQRVRDRLPEHRSAVVEYIDELGVEEARSTILAILSAEGPTIRSRLLRLVAQAADQIVGEVAYVCDRAITDLVAAGAAELIGRDRLDHPGACLRAAGDVRPVGRKRGTREAWEVSADELAETLTALLTEYSYDGANPVEAQIACDLAYIYDVPDWSFDAAVLAAPISSALEGFVPEVATPIATDPPALRADSESTSRRRLGRGVSVAVASFSRRLGRLFDKSRS